MNLWRNDWEKFVQEVARCHAEGLCKNEIENIFINSKVTWSGIIRNNELGQNISNGIAMDMPEVKIRLLDDRLIVANYIFLSLEATNQEFWKSFPPGQQVTFDADIKPSQSNFPEVEVSICSNNPEVVVALGTGNAAPVLY